MDAVHPALFPLTKDDHAAWVVVITITFFTYTFGAVTTKLSIRYKADGWRPNDILLAFGLLILFVRSICVIKSCRNGLGKHQHSVPSEELDIFDRVYLFLPSGLHVLSHSHLTCPSIALLISVCITASQYCYISLQQSINVSSYRRDLQFWKLRMANRVLFVLIITWAVVAIFGVAFECSLPTPWSIDATCRGYANAYLYNGLTNMLTDVGIASLPIVMLWRVQTNNRVKLRIAVLFGSRIV